MTETAQGNLIDRTLARLGRAVRDAAGQARVALTGQPRPDLPDEDMPRVERQIAACLDTAGGEVAARARAAELGGLYLSLSAQGKRRFLSVLARGYGPDPDAIAAAYKAFAEADAPAARAMALGPLRASLESPRDRLLRNLTAMPQGIKFLVDLRADLSRFSRDDRALAQLDDDLLRLLVNWFDIGFLDLSEITWHSPASLLEKLIAYEAVHRIASWDDLKNRLDSDRRCFAFFHPRMPDEPLIFVEVALVEGMTDSVQALLEQDQPPLVAGKADTAIFYSISNCQRGLAGVSFGDFLIKRVVDRLSRELPQLKTFATLSPIPGFRAWLDALLETEGDDAILPDEAGRLAEAAGDIGDGGAVAAFRRLVSAPEWPADEAAREALRPVLLRLCARYLGGVTPKGRALDRVAHFHLSNGARIERINWLGDRSANGLRQSFGLMVNYLYKQDEIEANHSAYTSERRIVQSSGVRKLHRE